MARETSQADVDLVHVSKSLTIREAARVVGITRQRLSKLVSDGIIPARRFPGLSYQRVALADVRAWQSGAALQARMNPSRVPTAAAAPGQSCRCGGEVGWFYLYPPQNTYVECSCRTRTDHDPG